MTDAVMDVGDTFGVWRDLGEILSLTVFWIFFTILIGINAANPLVWWNHAQNLIQALDRIPGVDLVPDASDASPATSDIITRLRRAIIDKESGGEADAVNPHSGALGLGQVMPFNVPSWTLEALGRSLTPDEFLADEAAQLQTINYKLSEYWDYATSKGLSGDEAVECVAAKWYSGQCELRNNTAIQTYGSGVYPSIAGYSDDIVARFHSAAAQSHPDDIGTTALSLLSVERLWNRFNGQQEQVTTKYTIATPFLYDDSPPGAWDFTLIDPTTGNQSVPVPSPCSGRISEAGWGDRAGNYARVNCNDGSSWYFAHFESLDVGVDDWVTLGDSLGIQGTTGNSTGIHIHLVITPSNGSKSDRAQTKPMLDRYFQQIGK